MLGHDGTEEPPEKGDSRQTDVGPTLQRAHFHEFRRRFVVNLLSLAQIFDFFTV
jgi:hypothetical protein